MQLLNSTIRWGAEPPGDQLGLPIRPLSNLPGGGGPVTFGRGVPSEPTAETVREASIKLDELELSLNRLVKCPYLAGAFLTTVYSFTST